MDFNGATEKWLRRPVLGLPLRMVFVCSWHRVHMAMIAAGSLAWLLGFWLEIAWVRWVGIGLGAPSAACVAAMLPAGVLLIILEHLLQDRDKDQSKHRQKRAPQSETGRAS